MINEVTRAVGAATMQGYVSEPVPGVHGTGGVSLRVKVGSRAAHSGERSRQYVLTEITVGNGSYSPAGMQGTRLPVNLSLVLDRSGSMEGEPLDYVKRAVSQIVDLMTPNDVLS
ncbi:MAG: hypothetical protein H7145_12905, partial [Akkermansiaceae bacterium]|nr:hypothetical protein [Armatimonadota bacterium]